MNKSEFAHFKRQVDFLFDPELGCLEFCVWRAQITNRSTVERDENYPKTIGGWYDDIQALKCDASRLNGISGYISLNPVCRDLMAVSSNKLTHVKKGTGTKEENIVSYRRFLIDIDCKRIKGVSATDGELQGTMEVRDRILEDYPEICETAIWGCSGNGAYIIVDIGENPVKKVSKDLVSSALRTLASRYGHRNGNSIFIDTGTFSPTTHVGLAGTYKCKGSSTDDRPFRLITVDGPIPSDVLSSATS